MLGLGLSNTKNEDERFVFSPIDLQPGITAMFFQSYSSNIIKTNPTVTGVMERWKNTHPTSTDSDLFMTQSTVSYKPTFNVEHEQIVFGGDDWLRSAESLMLHNNDGWTFFAVFSSQDWSSEFTLCSQGTGTFIEWNASDGFHVKTRNSSTGATSVTLLSPESEQLDSILSGEYDDVMITLTIICEDQSLSTNEIGAKGGADHFSGSMKAMGFISAPISTTERDDLYNWSLSII